MTRYVAGLLFSPDHKQIVLIKKARPNWQAGKLNFIGGHIEKTDVTSREAMIRECHEETGLLVEDWKLLVHMIGPGSRVDFYVSKANEDDLVINSDPSEPVAWHYVEDLKNLPILYNLNWLIPLAFDEAVTFPITVGYLR